LPSSNGEGAHDHPGFFAGILDTESTLALANFSVTGRSRNRDITSFVWLSLRGRSAAEAAARNKALK
jgi:hypothetical protein